jgi:hypothetical protein
MHFVFVLRFFPIFCWLRRLANAHWQDIVVHRAGVRPLARQNILPVTGADDSEQFHCVVRKCHQSAHHDGTCCKGLNPCSITYNISPRRGQWTLANLLSQQNVMSSVRAWTVVRKRASISALYCVLECLFSTPCLHLRSLHVTSRAKDLENVCFLEAVLPENCGSTLSVWQPQPLFSFVHIQTANILTQCCHLDCVGFLHLSSSL